MRLGPALWTLLAAATPAAAVDWRPLPAPAEYQATVDLDSVAATKGYIRFMVRRAYSAAQQHANGKEYFSTRTLYLADCKDGSATLAVTQHYGADRKLTHADVRPQVKRSEFAAPKAGSDVAQALELACTKVAQDSKGEPSAKKAEPAPGTPAKPAPRGSSGSGIVVHRDGSVLTNLHVVKECDGYEVIDDTERRLKASLRASDSAHDLALLIIEGQFPAAAAMRKEVAPRLGEAVTIVGYPLVGVLGAKPSVGFGNVTSTVGIRGNPGQMQISVPVQRGASGGPVLDQAGNLIGVVVAKLDALKFAERMGDLPQNVNFAIRGEAVRSFLEAQKVEVAISSNSATLESTAIASRGAAVTVRVRCLREGVVAPNPAARP